MTKCVCATFDEKAVEISAPANRFLIGDHIVKYDEGFDARILNAVLGDRLLLPRNQPVQHVLSQSLHNVAFRQDLVPVTCIACVRHLKMKRGRQYPAQTKRVANSTRQKRDAKVKELLPQIPLEVLEEFHYKINLHRKIVSHGLPPEDEAFFCWENPTFGDRPRGDSLFQLEMPFNETAREFREVHPGRHMFTPSHLVLACEGVFLTGEQTASHLCGNFRCLRFEHIIPESMKANVARKYCNGTARCSKCDHPNVFCEHEPKCLIKK